MPKSNKSKKNRSFKNKNNSLKKRNRNRKTKKKTKTKKRLRGGSSFNKKKKKGVWSRLRGKTKDKNEQAYPPTIKVYNLPTRSEEFQYIIPKFLERRGLGSKKLTPLGGTNHNGKIFHLANKLSHLTLNGVTKPWLKKGHNLNFTRNRPLAGTMNNEVHNVLAAIAMAQGESGYFQKNSQKFLETYFPNEQDLQKFLFNHRDQLDPSFAAQLRPTISRRTMRRHPTRRTLQSVSPITPLSSSYSSLSLTPSSNLSQSQNRLRLDSLSNSENNKETQA